MDLRTLTVFIGVFALFAGVIYGVLELPAIGQYLGDLSGWMFWVMYIPLVLGGAAAMRWLLVRLL